MMPERYVSYLRVSTDRQGKSGLGIDAQRQAIDCFLARDKRELIHEYLEVESGKKNERPQLQSAIESCLETGATLIIAKLDRLSRNVYFISTLMESGVEFVACDFPQANRLTIHILAAVAEHEREMISKRTKEALAAAKARGTKLGRNNLSDLGRKQGLENSQAIRSQKATDFALKRYPIILRYLKKEYTLRGIAQELNRNGILTASGKHGSWTASAVKNVIKRAKQAALLNN
ncbi:recombinase family protein [Deltaproteobacteria bacterium IMCC39524]|nr:recombinase family protein [Deltaproteobacteria bacterium IMCC39524]